MHNAAAVKVHRGLHEAASCKPLVQNNPKIQREVQSVFTGFHTETLGITVLQFSLGSLQPQIPGKDVNHLTNMDYI